MAAPENSAELISTSGQAIIAILTFTLGCIGVAWKFFKSLNDPENKSEHVVIERAELADMNPLRQFLRDVKPALERLTHIDATTMRTDETAAKIHHLLERLTEKINKMEEDDRVEKQVREELERRRRYDRNYDHDR